MTASLNAVLDDLFLNNQKLVQHGMQRKKQSQGSNKRDLELAVSVLLVDLAGADQNFDPEEYNMIQSGLTRLFGTSAIQVKALINQATLVIKNLRGTSQFAKLLKESLSIEERQKVMSIIDEVICADGVEDGFETYLRHKFSDLLEVEIQPLNIPKR